MEKSVVYIRRSEQIKNVRMKIVEFLISKGVMPNHIRINQEEFYFVDSNGEIGSIEEYCSELNKRFRGQVEFKEKFPDRF